MKQKIVAAIPARYNATRFPGKLMAVLGGKTVIRRTYEATRNTGLFDDVFVVTDSDEIEAEIRLFGGKVLRSQREHQSGSDRIAEVIETMDVDIVVNVQGDEPFTQRAPLETVLSIFNGPDAAGIDVATLVQHLTDPALIADPNYVKVVCDADGRALYFSRSPIPYLRDADAPVRYLEHIGVYAFRKQALLDFARWPMTPLEAAEKIECLRYLEHGKVIKVVETSYMGVEIDTPEDLVRAERLIISS